MHRRVVLLGGGALMPRRNAQRIAAGWRRADPANFGGDRHFQARIVPVESDHTRSSSLMVRGEKLFAVTVLYPAQ